MRTIEVFILDRGVVLTSMLLTLDEESRVRAIKCAASQKLLEIQGPRAGVTLRLYRQDFWGEKELRDKTKIKNIRDTVDARFVIIPFVVPKKVQP